MMLSKSFAAIAHIGDADDRFRFIFTEINFYRGGLINRTGS